jgi:hypothetical protein
MSRSRTSSANPWPRALAPAAALTLLFFASVAAAESVPVELRAAILLRALQYERGFGQGDGQAVVAVVASASGGSAEDGRHMADAFASVSRADSRGRPVRVQRVTHASASATASRLAELRPAVVYLARGVELGSELRSLPSGTIVLCAEPEQIGSACTVTVEVSGRTSRLVIDLPDAERFGLRFDARLLQLARVIR